MKNRITSFLCGDGSYGYRASSPGGIMTLWRCGIPLRKGAGIDTILWQAALCLHSTRARARACTGRQVVWGAGRCQEVVGFPRADLRAKTTDGEVLSNGR